MIRRFAVSALVAYLLTGAAVAADTLKPTWKRLPLPSREQVKGIEACRDGLLLATGVDVYTVRNDSVVPVLEGLRHRSVTDVLYRGSIVDVATSTGGVFRSTDDGLRWSSHPLPNREQHVLRIITTGVHDYALISGGAMYRRNGSNGAWKPVIIPDTLPPVRDIVAHGPSVVAVADSGRVLLLDKSMHWSMLSVFATSQRALVTVHRGRILAAIDTVLYEVPPQPGRKPTTLTILPADKWTAISVAAGKAILAGKSRRIIGVDLATGSIDELPVPGTAEDRIGSVYTNGISVLAGIDRGGGGLYTMRLDVPTWQSVSLSTSKNTDIMVGRIVEHDGTVAVCMSRNGLHVLDTSLRRAEQRFQGIKGSAVATIHQLPKGHVATSRTLGVFGIDACGTSVHKLTSDLPIGEGYASVVLDRTLFVSVGRVGLWMSVDGGRRWQQRRYPDSTVYIDRMDALGTSIIASSRDRSWISTDRGASWRRFMIEKDSSILRWTASKGNLQLLGTANASYVKRGSKGPWVRIITPFSAETQHRFGNAVIKGSTIVLGTKGAVLLSRDAGNTWKPIDIAPATFATYVTMIGKTIYVVSDKGELMSAPLPDL
ncbi:MAG: hypothetical protein FGM24_00940 [Candidatus Kapabacteria bacterium]|nr:hypothetical protein [Candidatus Kapabacteria bacterium]